jgi:hypothetical protein
MWLSLRGEVAKTWQAGHDRMARVGSMVRFKLFEGFEGIQNWSQKWS